MGEIVLSAAVGVALQEVFKTNKKGIPYIVNVFSSSARKKLNGTLNRLKPVIDEMYELSLESSSETWLRCIQDFQGKLADGLQLVEECQRTSLRKIHKKFGYAKRIQNLEKDISDFIINILLPNMALNAIKLPNYSDQLNNLSKYMKDIALNIDAYTHEIGLLRTHIIQNSGPTVEQQEWSLCASNTLSFLVGFDKFTMQLKELVLGTSVSVVGVTGMSGIGKSTLASTLCHHKEIRGLTTLPHSICGFQQLEVLDISLCGCLKEFPLRFNEISRLKKLDMRECRKLRHFSPNTIQTHNM